MKPRPFAYLRPASVAEAVAALAEHGEAARVLAGGQSLIAMLNLRLVDAAVLIDISRLDQLSHIRDSGDAVEVGAAVTQNRLLNWPDLERRLPLLARMLPLVGHFQTRNRGTVCGSIAHADPSSELPLALAMLDGEVLLESRRGKRRLKATEFQTGVLSTARAPDELITGVRFPVTGAKPAFREISRRHGDFAIVGVGVLARNGRVRLGIGGASDRPVIADIAVDRDITDQIEQLVWRFGDYEDIHAGARLRRDLVRRLAPQVIAEAGS